MERQPIQRPVLVRATLVGTLLQLGMVVGGHFSPQIANAFAPGGMAISAVAGLLYSVMGRPGTALEAAGGGVIAGAASALPGIIVSYLLGDVPAAVLGFGTASSGVTGLLGALLGRTIRSRRAP